ncbi:transposase, partial [Halogeometricum borinquense DSM 11551]
AIKHDDKHGQLRLSKGFNLKESRSDFILAKYETRPDVEVENIQQVRAVWNGDEWELHLVCKTEIPVEDAENIQQVRAVWNGDEWELHLVCKTEIPVEDAPGNNTAGIDLGISNYLAIDYEDGPSELYPGNVLKEDKHYFTREEYQTEGENGPSKRARKARQKLSRRKDHFLHTLSKHIVERCVEEGVEKIA